MICHVFKRKRKKNGKTVNDRFYSGKYRLDGDFNVTVVALKTTDKQVAEQRLAAIVKEKEMEKAGIIAPKLQRESADRTLVDHVEEFMGDLRIKGRDERYCKGVNSNINRLLKECSWKLMQDIKADDFILWRSKQTLAPKTLNEYLNAMNAFLNWMEKHGRTAHQPLKLVEKVDLRGKQQKRRAITDEEFKRLLVVSQDYKLLYLTAVYTGLRLGELSGLVWANALLDHKQPHIHVPAHLTKNREQAIVPLHPQLVAEFNKAKAGAEKMDFIFPHYKNPDRRFQRHRREAGIETIDETGRKLDFHSFRYTFATKLARHGVSQRLTQELMRHSDPRLTANLYTDVSHLPTFDAVQDLDWIEEPFEDTPEKDEIGTHVGTQNIVFGCHFLSQSGSTKMEATSHETPCHIKNKAAIPCGNGGHKMVGETGFEPATSAPPVQCATKLRYVPV